MEGSRIKRNIKPFDGEKYSVWKFRIRALLSELNILNVIDEEPIFRNDAWEKNNRMAKSVIIEYLSDSYLGFAKDDCSAKDILRSLDALYERKSIATQLALRKKLLALKLPSDVPLVKHFSAFDDLITELIAAGARLDETDKVAHLLLTLPSSFDGVITAIETLSEDNLTIAFVKTRLLDYEVKLKNESGFAFMTGDYHKEVQENKVTFLLDSGASDHIINREDLFINYLDLSKPLKISIAKNGEFISATKKGTLQVTSDMGVQGTLEGVLFCPEVPYNLLSVSKMQQAGYTIIFDQEGAQIRKNGKTVMRGRSTNNLIAVDFMSSVNVSHPVSQACASDKKSYKLWHQRLGHISKSKFLEIQRNQLFEDMNQIDLVVPDDDLCEACINGKQSRLPFNHAKDKSYIDRPLFAVSSDVCGPITPTTVDNKNYFVMFIDQYTHYCVTYLLTYKSDVFPAFKDFVAKSEAKFNLKVVNLYCDNGGEYLSTEMKNYCTEKGITYHLTVPRTPQQNGVSERMVRTIAEKARSLISGAQLDKVFWGQAVLTAVLLINLTPTKALKHSKTPYEMWHSRKPQIKYLKVFGSTVYVHNKTSKAKFDDKSWKSILMGYEPNGYKVWNPDCEKFVVVRDVIVDETNFLKSRPSWKPEENTKNSHDKTDSEDSSKSVSTKSRNSDSMKSDDFKSDGQDECPVKIRKLNYDLTTQSDSVADIRSDESLHDNVKNTNKNTELRRSDRIKDRPHVSYKDDDDDNDYLLCVQSVLCKVPSSFHEIKQRDDRSQWENAIRDELDSLHKNKTWTLVPRPTNKNIVDCKWVFTVKNDEFGNPQRYKARLVARGFSQEYLTDYNETFAPVARIASFRFIISFANQNNLLVHHLDVKTAFLNGHLKEEIYMRVPEGVQCNEGYVCKLQKALYGLKQAARCWFELFEQSLKQEKFQNSSVDRCIYMLDNGDVRKNIYVVLYVDDLVVVCAEIEMMNNFKRYLMSKFEMTDLKEIKLFLGIKVTKEGDQMMLDQSAYIKTVLTKFNMHDCKPASTPLENKLNYDALNSEEIYNAPCRNVIGCLMYIMLCTRPDLSVSVNILSRYTNKNTKELWQCLKRVLRYLKGTIDLKLCYKKCNYNEILCGYADSDWGGNDTRDRKSTTGYIFKLFDQCTITWSTRKQTSVAASSTEAEYMALYEAVKEALWLKSLAASININIDKPIVIYEDNNGCISIANNPTCHKRSKHIDIKYHFSREQVEKNVIKLNYIPTGEQLADALTKPLPGITFQTLRSKMGLY